MGWEYWNWMTQKRPPGQCEVPGSNGVFGDKLLEQYWCISTKIKRNGELSRCLRETGAKIAFFSPSDGFLPTSSVICSDFFPSWWSGERKRGLSSELLISCLFSCSVSESSFSLLAETSASPELVIWWPPFPRASWLKVHSCFPHSQTCHRWQVCWWLLGFCSSVVVMTNTYLPICVFRSWTPGYKKQIQQVESCLWFTCLFKFLGSLFCLI